MARLTLPTGIVLLACMGTPPAWADEPPTATTVATRAPTPLQEPHAVPTPAPPAIAPAKGAEPPAPRPRPLASRSKTKPASAKRQAAKPKAKAAARAQAAAKPKAGPPELARTPAPRPHRLARRRAPPMQEARRGFERPYPEERPHSGPVYETPPDGAVTPPTAVTPPGPGCDEACQYRDWLNRYAAWYRDFGRYYYPRPLSPAAPPRPSGPAMSYGENQPPTPLPAYRGDQSERARLDPWHGYNGGPGNGY